MTHTKGKLHYQEGADEYTHVLRDETNWIVAYAPQDSSGKARADARRLVACWNAMQPVSTGWIEKFNRGSVENILCENALLREELNKALAVLKQLTEWSDRYPSHDIYSHGEIVGIAKEIDDINLRALGVLERHKEKP